MDKLTTKFECGDCGAPIQWSADAKGSDVLTCGACGKPQGTLDAAISKHNDKVREAFASLREKIVRGMD